MPLPCVPSSLAYTCAETCHHATRVLLGGKAEGSTHVRSHHAVGFVDGVCGEGVCTDVFSLVCTAARDGAIFNVVESKGRGMVLVARPCMSVKILLFECTKKHLGYIFFLRLRSFVNVLCMPGNTAGQSWGLGCSSLRKILGHRASFSSIFPRFRHIGT